MKFKKKPIFVEAEQLTEEMALDCLINHKPGPFGVSVSGTFNSELKKLYRAHATIRVLGGALRVDLGDWIVKDDLGALHLCQDTVFRNTYEHVEE